MEVIEGMRQRTKQIRPLGDHKRYIHQRTARNSITSGLLSSGNLAIVTSTQRARRGSISVDRLNQDLVPLPWPGGIEKDAGKLVRVAHTTLLINAMQVALGCITY